MSDVRVYGTPYGGTEVELECPNSFPCVGGREPCDYPVVLREKADGTFATDGCDNCHATADDTEWMEEVSSIARKAINNYEPPEPDLNAVSAAERRELDVREYMRLKR
jgi:hypothetical protein